MAIIPTFGRLPGDGPMRLILIKAMRLLRSQAGSEAGMAGTMSEPADAAHSPAASSLPPGHASKLAAAQALDSIIQAGTVGGSEYFRRAWTLVERTARHGRKEALCKWLSLEAWLGTVVDALRKGVSAGEDWAAATRCMLDDEGRAIFDSLLLPLTEAIDTGSILIPVCEGMVDNMARLMGIATEVWASRNPTSAPDPAWMRQYLLDDLAQGIYTATHRPDLIWCVYSFLSTKWDIDLSSAEGLRGALEDLAYVGGVASDPRGAPEPALQAAGFTVCAKLYETLELEKLLGKKLEPIRQVHTELAPSHA